MYSFRIPHSSFLIPHSSFRILVVLLLLAFFAQALTSTSVMAPTFDEEFHIARAYAYVRTGDLRMQQNHPPLVSALAGLPLLLMPELTPPEQIPHWDDAFLFSFADNLFWRMGHDVDKMLFLARFPIILLGVLLGAFVYRWAREAYGSGAGLLAAGLYAFAPNLLAHTRLVTTDLAVTAFGFIALYTFWRYLRRPTGWRLLLAGLAIGLALSAKLSGLLLVPVIVLLALLGSKNQPSPIRHPHSSFRIPHLLIPLRRGPGRVGLLPFRDTALAGDQPAIAGDHLSAQRAHPRRSR